MSFILDALKKSELERQRQTVPGLMDAGAAAPRTRFPVWAIAIAALLGVNLVILLVVLLRSPAGAIAPAGVAGAPATPPPPALATMSAPKTAEHFSPLPDAPVYAPEIPLPAPPRAAQAARPAPEPVLHDDAVGDEVLPSISEINLGGKDALPELHLDVHVYTTSPADRFVYINMRKYREGAVLQEGPTVERIRRDGVVLNKQGLRFLLPRQ